MDLSTLGKWMIVAGLAIAAFGLVAWLASRTGIPFGHLPGDIHVERPGFSFSFPLVTCIVISILLTLVLNVVFWFVRK